MNTSHSATYNSIPPPPQRKTLNKCFIILFMQLITHAELEESPLYVPLHPFEGLRDYGHYHYFDCKISASSSLNRKWITHWFGFILADTKEKEVKCLDPSSSPPQKAQLAIDCLPISPEETTNPSFCRWTIMDYSKAYSSGDITPRLVFHLLIFFF